MAELSVRSYQLVVAPLSENAALNGLETGLDLSALDIWFRVKKTLKPKPNVANIKVWGLDATSRQYFQTTKKLTVRLEAGYGGENELLFLGETRCAFTRMEGHYGEEHVTYIETGDSEKDMAAAGLSLTFGSAPSKADVFKAISASLPNQVPQNQATKVLDKLSGLKVFHPKGGAVDRQTTRYLNDLCRSAGLEWSIQNGTLLVMPKGKALEGKEILISADSGMIGSPSVDHTGLLDVKSLILPGLHPGAKIYVDGESVKGNFRIETVEYEGNSKVGSKEWYAKMQCQKLT